MPSTFAYRAVTADGRRARGTEAAATPDAVVRALEGRGLLVLDVAQVEDPTPSGPGIRFGAKRDVLEVTRALAALLPAGLPLARALAAAGQLARGPARAALDTVRAEVERGRSLAEALAGHPALFSPLYVGLVRAGERSGTLDAAFDRLARQLEHEESLRARLLSASIYPLLLAVAGGAAILVLLFFVIPRFTTLLQDTGLALPRSTQLLLTFSTGLRAEWPLLAALAIGLPLLAAWGRVTPEGRRLASRMPIGVPLVRFLGQLVGVGEEAGRLAAFLTKAADTLGEQTERALRGAKTWLRR